MTLPYHATDDPVPDPEPAVPSLDEPDPGVFHRDPGVPLPHDPQKHEEETHR